MEETNGGFQTLVYEDDLQEEEYPPYHQSNRIQVSMFTMSPGRRHRLAAVCLALLAAVLLILNVGLGIHYNKLTDTHLTLDDTERISKELINLQDTYKTAVETMKDARKQLDSEMSRQTQTNWELEHQTKRSNDYKSQMEKVTKEIEAMRTRLSMLSDGCKHCPAGWILMNSVCYYFPLKSNEFKTWKESRDFCQLQGGDLIIIDSQDEENSTVNYLINHQAAPRQTRDLVWESDVPRRVRPWMPHRDPEFLDWISRRINHQDTPHPPMGFWIGLSDVQEDGTWKWYWNDGEPNDVNNEDCAALYPKANFYKSWNDTPPMVVENDKAKILWDFQIQMDRMAIANNQTYRRVVVSKYHHVVASLDPLSTRCVMTLLPNPPSQGKYTVLKALLLWRYSLSNAEWAEKLLFLRPG
ncbi:C-type lectin domain family 4 member G-like [Astatotilapia calliptera]|uniref:C-type lectin domain family 4 member G-like n=1 Tax=Astatotilapia calliptera TaxID=8154 RepID=UPI000E4196E0|nr:C-type lectin domain family 4 member G-like [Astatotilapia calliptera]